MSDGDSGVAWTWSVEISRLNQRIRELEDELCVSNEILEQRGRVLKSIPPCAAHGQDCVSHALEWIALAKSDIDALYKMRASREHVLRLAHQQAVDLIRMLQEGFSDYSDQLGRLDQKP